MLVRSNFGDLETLPCDESFCTPLQVERNACIVYHQDVTCHAEAFVAGRPFMSITAYIYCGSSGHNACIMAELYATPCASALTGLMNYDLPMPTNP